MDSRDDKPNASRPGEDEGGVDGRGAGQTRTIRRYTQDVSRPSKVYEEPINIRDNDGRSRPAAAQDVNERQYKNNTERILSEMGRRFTSVVTKDRAKALRQLQADLMNNLAELSQRTPLPQLIQQSLEIEEILKETSNNSGLSPLEFTKNWFNGEEKKVN